LRSVVQRVRSARVTVADEVAFDMGPGLLALVGVGRDDAEEDARQLARRLVGLRVFADADGRMNDSLAESGGTLAIVSQFSLFGDARHGRRPSFAGACPAERAEPLIEVVAATARELGAPVVCGRFQREMEVALVNSGPITILLDTRKQF
jgi:D-tyrosyl-tRNA(Tyr) deacylase